ncbi:MAG: dihydroxy-acid dehydratase [Dysosmobacter sp.]
MTRNPNVIHSLAQPLDSDGGLILCKGKLVPQGAFIKQSAVPAKLHKFRGTAKVFYDQDEAIAALRDGRIEAGNVVFILIRASGPAHIPRMPFTALKGSHLKDDVATVTDGRLSSTASGACFGYASPEAALRGPLCTRPGRRLGSTTTLKSGN